MHQVSPNKIFSLPIIHCRDIVQFHVDVARTPPRASEESTFVVRRASI